MIAFLEPAQLIKKLCEESMCLPSAVYTEHSLNDSRSKLKKTSEQYVA
jgi:hypothetical protein